MKRQRNMTGEAARARMPVPENWKAKCKIQNQPIRENHAVGTQCDSVVDLVQQAVCRSHPCLQREVVSNQRGMGLRFTKHDGLWQLTMCLGEFGIAWAAYTMKLLISNLLLMAIWMIVKMRSLNWTSHVPSLRQTPKFEYPHRSGKSRLSVHSSARARSSLGAFFLHDLKTCRALIEDVKFKKSGSWHHEIGCSTHDPDIYIHGISDIRQKLNHNHLKTYSYPNSGLAWKLSNLRRITHLSPATKLIQLVAKRGFLEPRGKAKGRKHQKVDVEEEQDEEEKKLKTKKRKQKERPKARPETSKLRTGSNHECCDRILVLVPCKKLHCEVGFWVIIDHSL